MKNKHLQQLLEETYPILPGQEARAWNQLKDRLTEKSVNFPVMLPRLAWASVAVLLTLGGFHYLFPSHQVYLASADSRQPGVYASSFYSENAQAQVVWLEGLSPASESPTDQDPTTLNDGVLRTPADASNPMGEQ